MIEGLLWYDDNPKLTLAEKIEAAAKHYHLKFGIAPDTCYVNKVAFEKDVQLVNVDVDDMHVRVLRDEYVGPDNYWIGCSDSA